MNIVYPLGNLFHLCYICTFLQVESPEFVEFMSGNQILPGSEPASHCYCGHQFGHFAGQLGDGCAQLVKHPTHHLLLLL